MNDNVSDHQHLEDDETLVRLLQGAGRRPPVPEWDRAVIKKAARKEWRKKVRQRSRRTLYWRAGGLLAAAALVLLVLGPRLLAPVEAATVEAVSGSVSAARRGSPMAELAVGDVVLSGSVVEIGGAAPDRAALRLAGGHAVRLDARTRLRLRSSTVLALDHGTVYVDSGEGSIGSIEIGTALGVARDIGTQFEVRFDATDLRLRVREGTVVLERDGESHEAVAGEQLTVGADGTLIRGTVSRHGVDWDWTLAAAPAFAVDGRTVLELLEWLARERGWELRFAEGSLRTIASRSRIMVKALEVGPRDLETISDVLLSSALACRFEEAAMIVESSSDP